jgi:hypothetical protein
MPNLSMPIGEHIRNEMRNMHDKCHEFSMHRNQDMNLSLFSISEFCTLEEQELRSLDYMKDVLLDEGISTKFISYFFVVVFYLLWIFKVYRWTSANRLFCSPKQPWRWVYCSPRHHLVASGEEEAAVLRQIVGRRRLLVQEHAQGRCLTSSQPERRRGSAVHKGPWCRA